MPALLRRRVIAIAGLVATVLSAAGAAGALRATGVAAATSSGTFHSLVPFRILDTRGSAPLGTNGTLDVPVAGVDGVPADATAAVINLTVTNPTMAGYLTLWPTGVSQPLASNLNFSAGQTAANLTEVELGGGKVSVYNYTGTADVVMDLEGYVAPDTASRQGDLFDPLQPVRLLDTRDGTGAPAAAPVAQGGVLQLQVGGRGGIPASGAGAVVLNLTATDGTSPTYLTAWPDGTAQPVASNLNLAQGETRANRVVVGVGGDGMVDIYNLSGTVDVIADATGWFAAPGGGGGLFTALTPARILDTRDGTGGQPWSWGSRADFPVQVAGRGGVPAMGGGASPAAVVANVTVTNTTLSSYLSAWPHGTGQPLASDLNWTPGETIANLVVVPLSSSGQVDLYNLQGCADVVVDVVGYYSGAAVAAGGAPAPAADPCAPAPSAGWLKYANYYRATAGEPGITEDPTLSQGDANHARYMVENDFVGHSESPSGTDYTASGAAAAAASAVVGTTYQPADQDNIDGWMMQPLDAAGILDPSLSSAGYGTYTNTGFYPALVSAAALNASTDRSPGYPDPWPAPVEWPGPGMTVPVSYFVNNETPSPVATCSSEYGFSDGLPVDLMVGPQAGLTVLSSSLLDGGSPLPYCEVDQNNASSDARGTLAQRGQVVLIPQKQLQPGHPYTASVRVQVQTDGGQTVTTTDTWTFWVSYTRQG